MSIPMTASSALNSQARESRSSSAAGSRYLCFGGFQLDTQRELLFKDGSKVRLPGKVFRTLVALLERPGEVVTREALREKLWAEGTFVNYDANVNTTVNKLRLVLGDSPDQPAYIETIPRLGYCFVGSVERRGELQAASASTKVSAAAAPVLAVGTAEAALKNEEAQAASAPGSDSVWFALRDKAWAAVLVLLCGMLIGMGIVYLAYRA
jgi:DNA-binding winged helix-turn-helix (wHTH) protein